MADITKKVLDTEGVKHLWKKTKDTFVSKGQLGVPTSEDGSVVGVATLGKDGMVPASQLPSYVDDVVEGYYNKDDGKFYTDAKHTKVIIGETGKIYVDLGTDPGATSSDVYRWSGSTYALISGSTALDAHISAKNNPHEVTKEQVGLGNVDNTSDMAKPVSTLTQQLIATKVDIDQGSGAADRLLGTDEDGKVDVYGGLTLTELQEHIDDAVSDTPSLHVTEAERAAWNAAAAKVDVVANVKYESVGDGEDAYKAIRQSKETQDESGNIITTTTDVVKAKDLVADAIAAGVIPDVGDGQAASGKYVSKVTQTDGRVSVTYTELPSKTDTAVDGEYVSAVSMTNGEVSVSRTALPDVTDEAKEHEYVTSVSQVKGKIVVTREKLNLGASLSVTTNSDTESPDGTKRETTMVYDGSTNKSISILGMTSAEIDAAISDA